jgi:hypothetical protein
MAITFFDASDKGSKRNLPFIEDYVDSNPPPYKSVDILSVSRTRKRTGYMVNTNQFSIFLFEGSQVLQHILEALNTWIQTNEGYLLVACPTTEEPFYQLGVDTAIRCRWILTQGKYTWSAEPGSTSVQQDSRNPFLPPTQKSAHQKSK